ncbi:MAG: response regulator [Alphaproteobacteria bacterium]|nr:response regulator [Alphaproteobacteria bacterium]MBU1514605.1 response regulator [Alphaproteobacteria bacterium]MBU2096763.1 response regulator [Alphaproteobacteria bacterium]MBU2150395.1 response regulator [Alphaproteobacteria bacterium]MBU2306604.1 response regulator [Alphaproteobacteria bacterium]
MSGLSVLVVDDEPLARRRTIRLVNQIEGVGRIMEAGDFAQACSMVDAACPDILLLDIQLPGGSGFEVLERVAQTPPAVIFVTAFDQHALRAFEANAVDYVTKPIEPGRFRAAMARARELVTMHSRAERIVELQETVASLRSALNDKARTATDFWVRTQGEHLRVASEAIVRFEADRDYVRIHVPGAHYLYRESLASLEQRLDPAEFVRIHRGAIVRRRAIVRVRSGPFAALIAVLADGSEVRVGRTYEPQMRAVLGRS